MFNPAPGHHDDVKPNKIKALERQSLTLGLGEGIARPLLSRADKLAKGAQLAAEQGDMAAFVELITGAAQLVQLAKLLERGSDRVCVNTEQRGR